MAKSESAKKHIANVHPATRAIPGPYASVQQIVALPKYDVCDGENPRAVVNIVPKYFREHIQALDPRWFGYNEEQLMEEVFGINEEPPPTHNKLRIAFWDEYDRAQKYGIDIDLSKVFGSVCAQTYFMNVICKNEAYLAWILHPTTHYQLVLKDIHELSLRNLRNVAQMSPLLPGGQPNIKLIEIQHKVFQHVDMRLKGAIIQRVDQRNLNVNVDASKDSKAQELAQQTKEDLKETVKKLTLDEINEEIRKLEVESKRLEAPGRVVVDLMKETSPIIEVDGTKGTSGGGVS